jgi:predicted DNA-binding WGR domain protein
VNVFYDRSKIKTMLTIRLDQLPKGEEWAFPNLYTIDAKGGVLVWSISFTGDRMWIRHGRVDGEIQTKSREVKLNSSGRTMKKQALLEMRDRYRKKMRKGYAQDLSSPREVKGMKGDKYREGSVSWWPVYVQPKLDGMRMLITRVSQGSLLMKSYENKVYTHLKYIEANLSPFFDYLPYGCTLDGELYNHDLSFNSIISAVRTVKFEQPDLKRIQYHIFDVSYPGDPVLEERIQLLTNAYARFCEDGHAPDHFVLVETTLVYNHQQVMQQHDEFVRHGYEGIMVKKLRNGAKKNSKPWKQSLYHHGRTTNILKYKLFHDEEADIIDVEESCGTEADLAMLVVRDMRGNVLRVRCRGNFDERREWLHNPALVIGKKLTIRYQELTQDGVPRFPVGMAIRDYE